MRPEMRSRIPRIIYEYARHRLTEQDMVEVGSPLPAGPLRGRPPRARARAASSATSASASPRARCGTSGKHLLSGHFVLIASGSPQYIVDEIGRHLRVHAAIGTRTRIVDGKVTDQIVPPVVFRDGKRAAVEAVLERWDLDPARSWLYSDSIADVPLFEAIGNPVVVNPKAPFRAFAERRGWEIRRVARAKPAGGAARHRGRVGLLGGEATPGCGGRPRSSRLRRTHSLAVRYGWA